ncbi:MAG: acyltransferase family protein [Rhizobiaceae bacterium]
MSPTSKAVFRTDLQSLRALAVVAVLLFHFKLLGVGGGYLGVDIFFVLSGFFITAMLRRSDGGPWKEVLLNFYQKRFWRIAPALFVTVIITLILGWFFILPQGYTRLGVSASYSVAFLSNQFFTGEASYFDISSAFKPLLHTWSLAVEMQFYLLWPLLFLVLGSLADKTQTLLLWLLIIATFFGAIVLALTDPAVAFYAMPFRLWEFAIGALCAHPNAQSNMKKWGFNCDAVRFAALAILIACIFFYAETLLWPAPFAALPVLATAILIATGEKEPGDRAMGMSGMILDWKPFVWIGEISYSLYLVHWPLVTILNIVWWPNPTVTTRFGMMALSLPLAWLLYKFIEQPFRFKWTKWSSPKQLFMPVFMLASILLVGQIVIYNNGFVGRYSPKLQKPLSGNFALKALPEPGPCVGPCAEAEQSSEHAKVFLWGDSHAGHFTDAIKRIARDSGLGFAVSSNGGCPPFPGLKRVNSRIALDLKCPKRNKAALRTILNDQAIRTVVLAARWSYYTSAVRFGQESEGRGFLVVNNFDEVSQGKSKLLFEKGLRGIVNQLSAKGKKIILLDQVPAFDRDANRCWVMGKLRGGNLEECSVASSIYQGRMKEFRRIATDLAKDNQLVRLHMLEEAFCSEGRCHPIVDSELAYRDNNHLLPGAAYRVLKNTLSLGKK